MTLDELAGERLLSGVDFETVEVKSTWGDRMENANACRFRLDGVTYVAAEDEEDGYRSSMRDLLVSDARLTNEWEPVRVVCSYEERSANGYDSSDVLVIRDVTTGEIVLRVGTENTDDYYPCYVAAFNPAALAHNAGKATP